MVIKIYQECVGKRIKYIMDGAKEKYEGEVPSSNSVRNIKLKGPKDRIWKLKYKQPPIIWKPKFFYLFGTYRFNEFKIMQGKQQQGMISKVSYDSIKTRYELSIGEVDYKIYPLSQGPDEFLLVFQEDTQIAHIKRNTFSINYEDNYTIYLLDNFSESTAPLLLFVTYYGHCRRSARKRSSGGRLSVSLQGAYSWSYGEANMLYDSKWLQKHFRKEKIIPVIVDKQKSKKLEKRLKIEQIIAAIFYYAFYGCIYLLLIKDINKLILFMVLIFLMGEYNKRFTV